MGTGHLILGKTTDYITGEVVPDTHDERIRQTIAQLLVDVKGFQKDEIQVRKKLSVTVDEKTGSVSVDFSIRIDNKVCMVVLYGPGSIVTRQRPALAVARLVEPYIVPFVVITNGRDAILTDASSGKVIGTGFDEIPPKQTILNKMKDIVFKQLSSDRREKEKRILFAMEVLTQQECDEYVCKI